MVGTRWWGTFSNVVVTLCGNTIFDCMSQIFQLAFPVPCVGCLAVGEFGLYFRPRQLALDDPPVVQQSPNS